MSYDVTTRFFHWMEANNITRKEAAAALGVDERSLSTYRSRGLPKKKEPRAQQIMTDHFQATSSAPRTADDNKVSVFFTDEDFQTVLDAAEIVGSQVPEFIRKAAMFKAKQEIENRKSLRVAQSPPERKEGNAS
jgi:uncharacterized protein (DUF1778 family)